MSYEFGTWFLGCLLLSRLSSSSATKHPRRGSGHVEARHPVLVNHVDNQLVAQELRAENELGTDQLTGEVSRLALNTLPKHLFVVFHVDGHVAAKLLQGLPKA